MLRYLFLVPLVLLGCQNPEPDVVFEGTWTGLIVSPGRQLIEAKYVFTPVGDSTSLLIDLEFGDFPAENLKIRPGEIQFDWNPHAQSTCILERVEGPRYSGSCQDDRLGLGVMIMAPPDVDVSEEHLNPRQMLGIWGFDPDSNKYVVELDEIEAARKALENRLGEDVEVDGEKTNVYALGEGAVTVVLEAGLGDNLTTWYLVQQKVSSFTRVVAYDRPGLGYSPASDDATTLSQTAARLRAVLEASGEQPPFLLVGQGLGGLFTRAFATQYPDEVAGILLIDAVHERLGEALAALDASSWDTYLQGQDVLYGMTPGPVQAEYALMKDILATGTVDVTLPPSLPVYVITAMRPPDEPRWVGETDQGLAAKAALQSEWADASDDGKVFLSTQSSGLAHMEDVPLVVKVIEDLVEEVQ